MENQHVRSWKTWFTLLFKALSGQQHKQWVCLGRAKTQQINKICATPSQHLKHPTDQQGMTQNLTMKYIFS
jgi:hypothetical protein